MQIVKLILLTLMVFNVQPLFAADNGDHQTLLQSDAQGSQFCQNFTGSWRRSYDGLLMNLSQDGRCWLNGNLSNARYEQHLQAEVRGNAAYGSFSRYDRYNGCRTILYVEMYMQGLNAFRWIVTGTDGRCELPYSYREDFQWFRY